MNNDDSSRSFMVLVIGVFGMVVCCFLILYRHEYWIRKWSTGQLVPVLGYALIAVVFVVLGAVGLRPRKRPPGPGQKQD
jgi:hypothetical protein